MSRRLQFGAIIQIVALSMSYSPARAQEKTDDAKQLEAVDPGEPGPSSVTPTPPGDAPVKPAEAQPRESGDEVKDWYVAPRTGGSKLESSPPGYAQSLDKTGIESLKDVDWFDFGLEHRTRFDRRDDSYLLPDLRSDDPFLMRSRAYLGFREILDPFRMAFEFQDSRQFNSDFPDTTRDANENDILQAYGELYFKDAIEPGSPIRFRFGRMTFDFVDRRLVGRNSFRNTTNAFDGFDLQFGATKSMWQINVFATRPVERFQRAVDGPDDERAFYGLVGAWRGWSEIITLEPYYLVLDADRKFGADREIHTLGLRGYGIFAKNFDYDTDVAFQTGGEEERDHRAFATHAEIGYSFEHEWKPRLALMCNYASGDANPADRVSERFDPLFGDSHSFYGYTDMFSLSNVINPALHLNFKPIDKVSIDSYYRGYWLAADADQWVPIGRVDPSGNSGDFIGHEIDLAVKYQPHRRVEFEIGYAHFMPGDFVKNTGPADDEDMFYLQTVLRF